MAYRQLYYKLLKFGMIVSSALMIWKGLMVLTNSGSPIIVVLSGDMQPAFYNRGDLLLLTNYSDEPIRVGENVVFKVDGKDIPIIHRVIRVHEKEDGSIKFLTKGDVNVVDDRGLYAKGQLFLENKDIVGRVRAYFPYLGIVSILMNDNPKFTYAILAFFSIKWLIRLR